jgi:hypothetical protein
MKQSERPTKRRNISFAHARPLWSIRFVLGGWANLCSSGIRCSRPYELTFGGARRWWCHELRKIDGPSAGSAAPTAATSAAADGGFEVAMAVANAFQGLAVTRSPWSGPRPLKFTTPHLGDRLLAVNGVAGDAKRMRKALDVSRPVTALPPRSHPRFGVGTFNVCELFGRLQTIVATNM